MFSSSPRRSAARCRVSTRWCGPTTTRTPATRPTSRRSSTSAPAPAATPPACGAAVSGSGVVQRGTKIALNRYKEFFFVEQRIFVNLNINFDIDDARDVHKIHRDKPQQGEDHSVGDSLLRPGRQVGRGHRQ